VLIKEHNHSFNAAFLIFQWLRSHFQPFWSNLGIAEYVHKPANVAGSRQRTEIISRETHSAVAVATETLLQVCQQLFDDGYKRVYLRNVDNDSIEVLTIRPI